ncbi:hypothetical protein like AT4G23370 [Hibiscus trionum]|uniref:Neprosin PEP catalytic domain-containing protein n=1 Tax=Hibiscus trionum TaxID=183268 RepID=A0A9W7MWF3_HIBTR|nr:hypothetical protein like AT4G23370 [Hibiscus trionum]
MAARFMIMPARRCRNFVLLLMLIQIMFGLLHSVQDWQTIYEEENLEMERQLKLINKPPIKSFKTDYGDILDCIDIYKQHAFDHPLLKGHKVQMEPKNIPKWMMEGESPRLLPNNIKCPPGSVLIKRTTKQDLIMAKQMNHPTSSRFRTTDGAAASSFSYATVRYRKHNFGATTTMNVWAPSTLSTQSSMSSIWIENGPNEDLNIIEAGWAVNRMLYSDNYTRLFAFWSGGHKTRGCFNYLCPGFVQVHREISLGLVLNQISVYSGVQRDIQIGILRDGEWWLKYFNQFIGYWPQKLFFYMYGGATNVMWGGHVFSPINQPSPAMGSGHFPKDGLQNKSAYFKDTQMWDNVHLIYPQPDQLVASSSRPDCYEAMLTPGVAPNPMDFFYGGPGQCSL